MARANAKAPQLNDYPTNARADYVFGCMKANGDTRTALDQCSCSIDVIASILPYDRYVEAEAVLSLSQVPGRFGAQFQDQVRYLLNRARNRKVGSGLLGEHRIASAARLQVGRMRSRFDGRNVDDLEVAGPGKVFSELMAYLFEPLRLVGAGTICGSIEAGVDQFEIEDRNALSRGGHRWP